GYYWLDQSQYRGTYPWSSTPFRPGEYVDLANRGTGLVTTNWRGGDWTQYSVLAATNAAPVNPAATQPAYQPTSPNLQYQLLVTYANSGAQASQFTINPTYIDPTTGAATIASGMPCVSACERNACRNVCRCPSSPTAYGTRFSAASRRRSDTGQRPGRRLPR